MSYELLAEAVLDACDYLEMHDIKANIKRRDPKEPGRREKELAEIELMRLMMRMFRAQSRATRDLLEMHYPDRKAVIAPPIIPGILEAGADLWPDIFGLVLRMVTGGIQIFASGQTIGMDYTLINAEAATFARQYVYDLLKPQIEATTRGALQKVISAFVETPGMTIGDLMRRLPFESPRAERVAVTEVTRAYAQGNLLAGQEMQRQFPDVRVVKRWWTNQDDRVCPLCGPLHGQEVELEQSFEGGYDGPPLHVGCRCYLTATTALAEL